MWHYGGKEICILASEGNKSLGKCRCSQEDDIKVDLKKSDGGMDWIHLPQDRGGLL